MRTSWRRIFEVWCLAGGLVPALFHGLFPILLPVNGEVVAYENWLLGLAEDCMPLLTPSPSLETLLSLSTVRLSSSTVEVSVCSRAPRYTCFLSSTQDMLSVDTSPNMPPRAEEGGVCDAE